MLSKFKRRFPNDSSIVSVAILNLLQNELIPMLNSVSIVTKLTNASFDRQGQKSILYGFWHCHMTVPFRIQKKKNKYRSILMVILLCVLKGECSLKSICALK